MATSSSRLLNALLKELPNGELTGSARDASDRIHRFVTVRAYPDDTYFQDLDISWILDRTRSPLLQRWATLVGQPYPRAAYLKGGISASDYCLAALSNMLVAKGGLALDGVLAAADFAEARHRVVGRVCLVRDQCKPKGLDLTEAFTDAWRQLTAEILDAGKNEVATQLAPTGLE